MYRCHFTCHGKIVAGEDLDTIALEEAIREGQRLLIQRAETDSWDGFEIWARAHLLYVSRPFDVLERHRQVA